MNRDPRHDADMNDNLDDVFADYLPGEKADATLARAQTVKASFEELCRKCGGSGRFISYTGRDLGSCFKCKGLGKQIFRTSVEQREKGAAARQAAKHRAEQSIDDNAHAWLAANPTEDSWLRAKRQTFDFAASMWEALFKYGHLTEKQAATVTRLVLADIERDKARAAERIEREASAPEINVAAIEQAFGKALSNGLKNPKLLLDVFRFKPAKAISANAGALYVTDTTRTDNVGAELYLGKIVGGKFIGARGCDDATARQIVAAAADPEAAAVAYGQRTGSCAICSRELTNHASIDRGIGPICAGKYGW